MSHILNGIIPANFTDWRVEVISLPSSGVFGSGGQARTAATARRTGITLIFVQDDEGWWTVTKSRGGQQLGQAIVKNLPSAVSDHIESERRRQCQ